MVNSAPGGTKEGTFVQRAQWVQMFEQWSNRLQITKVETLVDKGA